MSEQDSRTVVEDQADRARYEARIDGKLAGVLSYVDDEVGDRVLQHTVVGDAFGGRGVGSALAAFAIEDAREVGRRIVPQCTFVQGWLEKHPEHASLVAEAAAPTDT